MLNQAASKRYLVSPPGKYEVAAHLREAAREIHAESFLLAHRGNYSKAIVMQALGLNIANQAGNISHLGGILQAQAIDRIGYISLQEIMTVAGPNQTIDQQVEDAVRTNRPTTSLREAFIEDIPEHISEVDAERSNMSGIIYESMDQLPGSPDMDFGPKPVDIAPAGYPFVSKMADAGEAHYIRQQLKAIDAASLTYNKRTPALMAIDIEHGISASDALKESQGDTLSISSMPIFTFMDLEDKERTSVEQVTLAAASVLSAKAQTGSFPSKLPGTFMDPFSEKPLIYRTTGKAGFIIYSVGPTGHYNGKTISYTESRFLYPAPPPRPVSAWLLKH